MRPPQEFLDPILADWDSDQPRLLLSDWLTEQGDPWGELIRVQCTLHRLDRYDARAQPLFDRFMELYFEYQVNWSENWSVFGDAPVFNRGLLDGISMQADLFIEAYDELFEQLPTIRSVQLDGVAPYLTELAKCPALAKLDSLTLAKQDLEDTQIWLLVESPYVGGLQHLSLANNELGDESVNALSTVGFTRLKSLHLQYNNIASNGLKTIVQAEPFARLSDLNLRSNRIRRLGARASNTSHKHQQLKELDLSENGLTCSDIDEFDKLQFPSLEHLDISQNRLRADGIGRLCDSPLVNNLKGLNLRYDGVRNEGAASLANTDALGKLKFLKLGSNNITDEGTTYLAMGPSLPKLKWLDLSRNYIGDNGAYAIMSSKLSKLERLELFGNPCVNSAEGMIRQAMGDRAILAEPSVSE